MSRLTSRTSRLWSRREIEGLIADGRKIIILDGQVIKADAWLPFHPGGDKAILHMVGRDGTDEIRALHSLDAQAHMQKFVIGRIEGRWTNFLPPQQGGIFRPLDSTKVEDEQLDSLTEEASSSSSSTAPPSPIFDPVESSHGLRLRKRSGTAESTSSSISLPPTPLSAPKLGPAETFTAEELSVDLLTYPSLDHESQDLITTKYREMGDRIRAAGLYNCPYQSYAVEITRYSILFGLFMTCLHFGQYALSGAFLGLFWHQLVFSAHDAGHMGITHKFHVDTCIGIVIADFLGGLSMGWWKRSHNVHHIVTNSPEHDPDIELMPFFAISHKFFHSLRSTYYDRVLDFDKASQILTQYQHFLYYPVLLFGRFNLYVLSWSYLLSGTQGPRKGPAWWHRYFEIAGHIFFWYWFGYQTIYLRIPSNFSRFAFVMISHMITAPLHVQITLSHYAMSTSDLGVHESFPQKMLRTTMDVDCPQWLDFIHGGLQFQAVHHLYPRIPRHNLRKAQVFVRQFCEETGIPYSILKFTDGNKKVIGRLGEVAGQLRVLEECRKAAAKDLLEGHHHH